MNITYIATNSYITLLGISLFSLLENNKDLDELNSFVYTDHTSLSYRLDGNNVDIDQEEAYLAENQIRYQALVDQMAQEFGRYSTVLKSW